MVESMSGRKIAGGSRNSMAITHASVRSSPVLDRRRRRRSQREHSAVAPGGSGGMLCVKPQSAQVIVIRREILRFAVQEQFPHGSGRRSYRAAIACAASWSRVYESRARHDTLLED